MANNFGSKRIVVGAHYGLRDWLSQRITAVLMALFTLVLLAQLLFGGPSSATTRWAGIFSPQWMKVLHLRRHRLAALCTPGSACATS